MNVDRAERSRSRAESEEDLSASRRSAADQQEAPSLAPPRRMLRDANPERRSANVLALQRVLGNRAVAALIGRQTTDQDAPVGRALDAAGNQHGVGAPAPANTDIIQRDSTPAGTISIAADDEGGGTNLGHSWVMLDNLPPDGKSDSYGFWPKDLTVLGSLALGWYPGYQMHPDTAHTPRAKETVPIDADGLQAATDYASAHVGDSYHLLFRNCTHFARGMYKAATGQDAPSAGLVIEDPNELQATIEQENKERGMDPNENPLPADGAPPKQPELPSGGAPDAGVSVEPPDGGGT